MKTDQIQEIIKAASQKLFLQFKYSNGFTSKGKSELAEAALVTHIAAEFISRGHVVWSESPFRNRKRGQTKHLDLLIQVDPLKLELPDVLTLEAKAVATGHGNSKIDEIIKDHGRICDWKVLDPSGQPIFFSIDPPQRVRGVLAVLITEKVDRTLEVPPNSLSKWWKQTDGEPARISSRLAKRLRDILKSATVCDVEVSSIPVGKDRHSVAYAIFGCDDQTSDVEGRTDKEFHSAEHEAAHAVVGLRSGFSVEQLSLHQSGPHSGKTYCDWKASRGSCADDQLLIRAFAMAYAGCIIDMCDTKREFSEVINDLPTDVDAIRDVRQTAVDWGVVASISDTANLSTEGFILAQRLIEENGDLIIGLADELLDAGTMDREAVLFWYEEQTAGEAPDAI